MRKLKKGTVRYAKVMVTSAIIFFKINIVALILIKKFSSNIFNHSLYPTMSIWSAFITIYDR